MHRDDLVQRLLEEGRLRDGSVRFVAFYARDDEGRVVPVGRPFLYGPRPVPNADPRYVAAQAVCGGGDLRPTVGASR